MNHHKYKGMVIEVFDEPTYKYGSADNIFCYSKHYFSESAEEYPTSKHGVKIFRDEIEISDCVVVGSGGATGIHKNSSLVDSDQLMICCCDTIFCLTLPDLRLKWNTKADPVTCFQIFSHQDGYIVHGEVHVSKLDKYGQIKWLFGGKDIFVSIENRNEFKIENDGILLMDFAKTKYKIDFDGKLLWDACNQ